MLSKKMREKGYSHRDLKLPNILYKLKNGRIIPKLADYGFSKQIQGDTGTVLGTPATMAPEVLLHQHGQRSQALYL